MHIFKTPLFILLLITGIGCSSSAQVSKTFFNQAGKFLSSNVKNGKVAYKDIKQNPEKLNKLVKKVSNTSLDGSEANKEEAFYINAYNLLVIHSLIGHGIPSSPQDIDGFFDTIKHKVAGEELTLDQIETKKLREVYHDPRLHFSLVCGAVSCPPIRPFAYQPKKLDQQLDEVTKNTLNSNFIRIKKSEKTAEISEIFKWYKQDFVDKAGSARDFINRYRSKKIPADYTVKYYDYDWKLNAQE